jgi:hypothetical protein
MAGEFLRVVRGATTGAEIRVESEEFLGREVDGAGYLGESPELSRRHARLSRASDGGLMIEDLGSLNGTVVNGERQERARRLAPGDSVKLGDVLLVVVDAQGRSGQPTAYGAARPERPARDTQPAAPRIQPELQWAAIAVGALVIALLVFLVLH